MQEEQELQKWLDEVLKWDLKPLGKYEAKCSACAKRIVYDMGIDEAISALKNAGWELRDKGPCCTGCQEKE